MRAQLGHLAAVSEGSRGLTIQVLPFASGAHAAAGTGPAVVLRFSQAPSLGVVQLASLSGGVFLEDEQDIALYVRALTQLRASALPRVSRPACRAFPGSALVRGPSAPARVRGGAACAPQPRPGPEAEATSVTFPHEDFFIRTSPADDDRPRSIPRPQATPAAVDPQRCSPDTPPGRR